MGHWLTGILVYLGLAANPAVHHMPPPSPGYVVHVVQISDEKSVFATIESAHVVPARVRTGGTIIELRVKQGDRVEENQVLATVGDAKLSLTVSSYAAQVQAAQAQLDQAKVEFQRAQRLIGAGAISQNSFDQTRTAYNVAASNLKSMMAQRAVIEEQQIQGQILAPTPGRVITVPVTAGTVVMPGDVVATVAEQNFVLRLEIPEQYARTLSAGAPMRLDGSDVGLAGPRFGKIVLIYPDIQSGNVVADAVVEGLSDYFVGRRVRVWISAGAREAIIVPENLIITRFGIDYARVWTRASGAIDVPVQRGQSWPTPKMRGGLEILSGLKPGDRLLHP